MNERLEKCGQRQTNFAAWRRHGDLRGKEGAASERGRYDLLMSVKDAFKVIFHHSLCICQMSPLNNLLISTPPAACKISTRLLLRGRRLDPQLLTLNFGRAVLTSQVNLVIAPMRRGLTIELFDGLARIFCCGQVDKAVVSRSANPAVRLTRGDDFADGLYVVVVEQCSHLQVDDVLVGDPRQPANVQPPTLFKWCRPARRCIIA